MIAFNLDDEISYELQATKTIVQDTVRLRVLVDALVSTAQRDPAALEARIRSALETFIKADWLFCAVNRVGATVGFEQVRLLATARLPNQEVYDLESRARNASTEGLSLTVQGIDYSLPTQQVSDTLKQLRATLLSEVKTHIIEYGEQTERSWRIGTIRFASVDPEELLRRRYRKSLSADDRIRAEDEDGGITGAERVTVTATVTLRATA
jgi:hypothetical protein